MPLATRARLASAAATATALCPLAPAAGAAPSIDPPVGRDDSNSDVTVLTKKLVRTVATRRQARAAEIRGATFSVETHDGVRSARITTRMLHVLPKRAKRYQQRVYTYFDEEMVAIAELGTRRGRFESTAGLDDDVQPGCGVSDVEIDDDTVSQWVPTACLLSDISDMTVFGQVHGVVAGKRSLRLVGVDALRTNTSEQGVGVRWR
jgi:hypothetical protein